MIKGAVHRKPGLKIPKFDALCPTPAGVLAHIKEFERLNGLKPCEYVWTQTGELPRQAA